MHTTSNPARESVQLGTILVDVTSQSRGKYELNVLREQCRKLDVEDVYETYVNRARKNLLISFLAILAFITICYCLLLICFIKFTEDIAVYLGLTALTVVVLVINLWKKVFTQFVWIMNSTTVLAVVLLVAMDMTVPILHLINHYEISVPLYYSFIIYSIYIFIPTSNFIGSFLLGLLVSTSYIALFILITYNLRADGSAFIDSQKIVYESLFMVGINILGLFFRLSRELVIRTTLIDKRNCIEENLLLQAAKTQESVLLLTMIPSQIADKMKEDIKLRVKYSISRKSSVVKETSRLYRKLFIEPHDDVTILYADMVNYTYLTTTLDVRTLVETLHDLFVKFDDAALEFNVLRIQFLGDCYYCVGNVSIPNEEHAIACVKLGLRMISDIRQERRSKNLEIDMRIGVHTGSVLSGVIGAAKWQFDIYSKDVDIANRLESTGQPGRVHVSRETLRNLHDSFEYEAGTEKARHDPLLQKYRIQTYLIQFNKQPSPLVSEQSFNELIVQTQSMTSIMKSVHSFDYVRSKINFEMHKESNDIPVETVQFQRIFFGKSKQLTRFENAETKFRQNFSWLFMCFKNWRWEHNYMIQPDIQLKYSVLVSYVIILFTFTMQAMNETATIYFWVLAGFGNTAMLLLLALVWYKKLWEMTHKSKIHKKPRSKISRWFFRLSRSCERSYIFRICIYFVILTLQLSYTLIQMLDCDRFKIENEQIEILLFQDGMKADLCFNTWAVTECIILNLFINFLFSHITYIIKLVVGVAVLSFYVILMLVMYDFIYERSLSSNSHLYPEYAHVFVLCVSLFVFNIMNRQKELIARVDYYWKRALKKKQDDAKFTNDTISKLISNILPSHIVDIYMGNQLQNKLYYEEYSNVAVMFATILNYDIEVVGMRVLNEIICDFDEVLSFFKGVNKIEKIKVAGWTYMAACGLHTTGTGHRRSTATIDDSSFSLSQKWRKEQWTTELDNKSQIFDYDNEYDRPSTSDAVSSRSVRMLNDEEEPVTNDDVVYVMARFALDLLRAMRFFNKSNIYSNEENAMAGDLRIGIANGPVMAGVVGLYKPHYDIWGNAVNMASRMDSTGIPNQIQVTEKVANTLQRHKINCSYRGKTYVKGRGSIPTYVIDIDEDLNFERFSITDDQII
ncbi:adenylyl cyclase X E-like [Anastrepha obliqua]|uniref:adenylyl cyclase X E-like n=1 Tax=Anastrepha obliqua TaxID=95512 RepID=UPI0024098EFC|nr:adenylyl cyclase X E-like [Anastrepha obliqua]